MLDTINYIYDYVQIFISFSLFTYIYKYFFDACNEKKSIKGHDNKIKKVIKTKIALSFIYFFLTILLYFTITIRVLFTIISIMTMGLLLLTNKFSPTSLNSIYQYDSNKVIKKIWNVFYTVINVIFKILGPIHNLIDININNKINNIKKVISNINVGGFNLGMFNILGDLSSNNTINVEKMFGNKNTSDKNENTQSNLDRYILSDTNTNTNTNKNKINEKATTNDLKNMTKSNAKIIIDNTNNTNNIDDTDNIDIENKLNNISSLLNIPNYKNKLIDKENTDVLSIFKKMNTLFANTSNISKTDNLINKSNYIVANNNNDNNNDTNTNTDTISVTDTS